MGALLLQEAKDTGVLIPKYLSPDEIREWNIGVVKKRVERIKACEALLVKSGAKPFVELKNTTSSISAMTEEKQSSGKEPRDRVDPLRTAYQYYGGEAKRMKSFKWTTAQPGEEADRYHALFDACFRGDATKILELTVNGPPGKEALVACRVSYRNSNNYLNLFAVSILFGHSECLKALLEAASRQYAAVPVEDEKEKGKIAKLSNRAPLQMMMMSLEIPMTIWMISKKMRQQGNHYHLKTTMFLTSHLSPIFVRLICFSWILQFRNVTCFPIC
ncbi:hypothetical protein M427DRAFT_386994 [Gonapodya prolifera JEL478]|uniref:Uncharacterized protein n=1 Tax=Gonapodya prolifera (strain JEL478) TaxID=1344416 RepID=A0A139A8A4_GONPJ|nr:hypothetical protein M427DRAFT_386994 [Gonapodya prolifera JEL478]|eukprot:KXS12929.1 hypothetical protein M427DRAFT_386994 [Gonapodya prolifera JEL478]